VIWWWSELFLAVVIVPLLYRFEIEVDAYVGYLIIAIDRKKIKVI